MRQSMDKETEIKLRVSPAAITSLREHPLLNRRRTGEWHTGTLYNQYYDTAERDLALARVALRVRRDGEQYIQTLKSKGQSVAGLSERNEWDWPTDGPGLDLTLLDDSCWPASLAALDKLLLQPVFTTDFQRTKARRARRDAADPVSGLGSESRPGATRGCGRTAPGRSACGAWTSGGCRRMRPRLWPAAAPSRSVSSSWNCAAAPSWHCWSW